MGRPYKVLIVEDELIIRIGIKFSVDWFKYEMVLAGEAADGLEAWALYQSIHPDIVMIDIRIPGIDGLELIQRIRALDKNCYLLAITCMNDFETVYNATRLGVSDYLLKSDMTPESMAEAITTARKTLDARHRGEEARGEEPAPPVCTSADDFDHYAESVLGRKPVWLSVALIDPRKNNSPMILDTLRQLLFEVHGGRAALWINPSQANVAIAGCDTPESSNAYSHRIEKVQAHFRRLFSCGFDLMRCCVVRGHAQEGYLRLTGLYEGGYWLNGDVIILEPNDDWPNARRRDAFDYLSRSLNDCALPDGLCAHIRENMVYQPGLSVDAWQDMLVGATLSGMREAAIDLNELPKLTRMMMQARNAYREVDACIQFISVGLYQRIDTHVRRPEIRKALQFIFQHYADDMSVTDIARHVGLSANYFSNLFRRESGLTPATYLMQHRIKQAKRLLSETDLPVYAIAARCGFSDDTYFSRTFKEVTGMRPSSYRAERDGAE